MTEHVQQADEQSGTIDLATAAGDLRVRGVQALRGPNRWRLQPVVAGEVELGRLARTTTADAEGFGARLLAALPALSAHAELALALERGTEWADVVKQVAMALQAAVGAPVSYGVARRLGASWHVAIGFEEEDLAVESLYEAAALVRDCLRGDAPDVERTIATLRGVLFRTHPGATGTVLIQAARARGIPVRRFPGDPVIQLGLGANLRRLDAAMTDRTSVIATDITSNKDRTKRILERAGLPVPRGGVAADVDDAVALAGELGYPVIVKPLDANDGRGISGRLDADDLVRGAYAVALAEHPTVLVERYAEGRDHRVVVVNGRVVAVAERVPAHVVGDGRRTIRELAEETNRDPRRDPHDPAAPLVPLPLDAATERYLSRHGHSLDSVPGEGERVELRGTANISTGGTSIDRTDELHPRNAALCLLAADATGLDIAGIDVLTPDISVPFDENGAAIIEVNASPGIRMHTDPDVGTPRDVAGAIIDALYPPGAPFTIPILAVTGTNGKTTTTRLLAHLFRATGARVGFTTTDGVYYGEHRVLEGDLTGPFAAGVVLGNPRVDVAVLETARGGILRSGLGYEACDVGVVLNVSPDHLGLKGIDTVEQLAEVKTLIPAAVRPGGAAVLNADQPLVRAMRKRTRGRIVYFSALGEQASPHMAEHLAGGGTGLVVEEHAGAESFVIRRGAERIVVAPVAEVPLTVGGAARFQVENILAAIAAADAAGMAPEQIALGLRSFIPTSASTPGRMNLLRIARGTVVIDYAHNPAAVRGIVDFAARMPANRRIGVITMPGDRRDEDLRELGEAAAGFDYVIIKEHDVYRRGRTPGDVSRLIAEGLEAGGLPRDRHETVLQEPEAVERALALMEQDDLAVILADDTASVLAQIQPLVI